MKSKHKCTECMCSVLYVLVLAPLCGKKVIRH